MHGIGADASLVRGKHRMKPSLAARLMLGYAAVIAAVLISAWWSYQSLAQTEFAAQRLSDRSIEGMELTMKLERLVQNESRLPDVLFSDDPRLVDAVRPHFREFDAWIERMTSFVRSDDERALLNKMRENYREYGARIDAIVRLEEAGRKDEARRAFAGVAGSVEALLANGQQLFAVAERTMRARRATMDDVIAREHAVLSWLTGTGALFSLMLGFLLSRYATRPIYRLVLRLGAAGVVDSVSVDGDELGALETHVTALLDRVRQQERALQQAEKLAELGEIASQIAHETLNPVAGVKSMMQALRRTELPPGQLHHELVDMERQLGRVETTVRRLMQYARPLEPRIRDVPVRNVLDGAVRTARLSPGASGRKVRVIAPSIDGLTWTMDGDLIEQVLVNLVVNGCESSPPGGTVDVCAEVHAGRLCLSVHDRGRGLAPAIRDRLFRPFVTTKRNGNGLGLAVSRNIIQEHGGSIEAVSESDGCIFRIVLPGGAACASPS